ncbi:unnamed protein product [Lactuca saligna]|uniref:SNF2 N-terminal domain-containing protein n=1 Tax=Lactuca saligna TaxID=75948 RepID=A0AA35YRZ9_LACSI|nr:unnamed protein product [Lactuca saligna]
MGFSTKNFRSKNPDYVSAAVALERRSYLQTLWLKLCTRVSQSEASTGSLIVCPGSVLHQWARELDEKVAVEAKLEVLIYHGLNRTHDPDELAKYDVVLTFNTYSIVAREVPAKPFHDDDDDDDDDPEFELLTVLNGNDLFAELRNHLSSGSFIYGCLDMVFGSRYIFINYDLGMNVWTDYLNRSGQNKLFGLFLGHFVDLNMVAASHLILLDVWWNPAIEDEAQRMGHTRLVTVLRITIKDTVEDRGMNMID